MKTCYIAYPQNDRAQEAAVLMCVDLFPIRKMLSDWSEAKPDFICETHLKCCEFNRIYLERGSVKQLPLWWNGRTQLSPARVCV